MNLKSHEAQYVLAALVKQKKLRVSQVRATLRARDHEIRDLRERLAALEAGAAASVARGRRVVRRRAATAKVLALRKLQGRYMGFVRRLKAAEKARVRAIREKQGLAAAIRAAASLGKKK
jgi:hypothetical protein